MTASRNFRPWLVLPPPVWRDQLPRLVRTGGWGVARLTRNFHVGASELVVRDMVSMPQTIRGDAFGPLDDLLLVQTSTTVADHDADRVIARFAPLPSQLVAALVVGFGAASGRWVGVVRSAGDQPALSGLTLVGPGMRRIVASPDMENPPLTEHEHERWSRTRGALGDAVLHRVRRSRVAVIGAGRNGSVAAMTLAKLGVQLLVLVDADRDEWHNLDATIGASARRIGRPKVTNRAEFLRDVRESDLKAIPLAASALDAAVLDHLRPADLIVTCVDRDSPRLAAALVANRLGKIHLDIGSGIFREEHNEQEGSPVHMGGDTRLLLPREACVACLGGLRRIDQAWQDLTSPPGALRHGPRRRWNEERAGSLITVNQIAVNLGIQMWLDLLAGRISESRWCRVEWTRESAVPRLTVETVANGPCAICRGGENDLTWAA